MLPVTLADKLHVRGLEKKAIKNIIDLYEHETVLNVLEEHPDKNNLALVEEIIKQPKKQIWIDRAEKYKKEEKQHIIEKHTTEVKPKPKPTHIGDKLDGGIPF